MSAEVLSPLPGLVATVHVNAGDAIASGDPVVTLQSMKMEIPITAESDGTIAEILVSEGDEIDTGAVIARLSAGLARAEAARTFGVTDRTMRRWQQRRRETGTVVATPRPGRQRRIAAVAEPALREQVRHVSRRHAGRALCALGVLPTAWPSAPPPCRGR